MGNHPNSIINLIPEEKLKEIHHLDFGTIFFLDNTVVTELNEAINYDWEKSAQVISLAEKFYGKDFYIHYIANRINDYSVVAQNWLKFFDQNRKLRSFSIVTYGITGTTNIAIERLFYKEGKIHHFTDLTEALKFTGNLQA